MAMISGIAQWAKIINPVLTYDKTDKEWTFDLRIDAAAKKTLASLGCAAQVKTDKEGNDYIKFSRRVTKWNEDKSARVPAKPIRIVDKGGKEWDGRLIGNGSKLNVQFAVNDKAMGGKKANIIAVQVVDLVEFEGKEREDFPVYDDENGVEQW